MYGIRPTDGWLSSDSAWTIMPRMKKMGVEELILDFQSTKNTLRTDPWVGMSDKEDQQPGFEGYPITCSCQKVIVDWILQWAKEYIVQFDKVSLEGYIKNSTKHNWDAILEQERAGIPHPVNLNNLKALGADDL